MQTKVEGSEKTYLDSLIEKHWQYVKSTLNAHGIQDLKRVEHHYKTAFAHGWKHHKDYMAGSLKLKH